VAKRTRRTVIDNSENDGFENAGVAWHDRGEFMAFTGNPTPPEEDYFVLDVPTFYTGDGTPETQVVVWGMGLISFGAPTAQQIAYMATLTPSTDAAAFLAGFPGDYIAVGFSTQTYGEVEFGRGLQDQVLNPFNGGYYTPGDPSYVLPTPYDVAGAGPLSYVVWTGAPYEGYPEDYNFGGTNPTWPGGSVRLEFRAEGFTAGPSGATYRFGNGTAQVVPAGATVEFNDFDMFNGTSGDDNAPPVPVAPQTANLGDGNDSYVGGAGADHIVGGSGNDVLRGGAGVDRLEGGEGNDDLADGDGRGFLDGGAGNDVIRPGRGEDVIDGGEGFDTLLLDFGATDRSIDFTLLSGTANYSLPYGFKQISGIEAVRLYAGAAADYLTGGGADDILSQGGGGGTMNGLSGNDQLLGGTGDDHAYGGEGKDKLSGAAGDDRLDGGADADQLAGGEGSDTLTGGDGNDRLLGETGRDRLDGGAGDDFLDGGAGGAIISLFAMADLSSPEARYAADDPHLRIKVLPSSWTGFFTVTITDTQFLSLSAKSMLVPNEFGDLVDNYSYNYTLYDSGGNIVSSSSFAGGEDTPSTLDGNPLPPGTYRLDFSADTFDARRGLAEFDLILAGAPGSDGDDLRGGLGNDVYVVDSLQDAVVELAGQGTDEIRTELASYGLADLAHVENLTGGTAGQTLAGNDGNNVLDGKGGADTMIGGAGDDTYIVSDAGDAVVESAGGGTDTVQSTISYALSGEYVENLFLTGTAAIGGTGNSLGNLLVGNAAANRLDGGGGRDKMVGGAGDDSYWVDDAADKVIENLAEGSDRVYASVDYGLRAGVSVEILTTTNKGGLDAIDFTGNEFDNTITGNAGVNVLNGGGGNDKIDGYLGADQMIGGAGDDSFYVDNGGDTVEEAAGGGLNDRVYTTVSYTLAAGMEIELLSSANPDKTASLVLTGNEFANGIIGNAGANRLDGGGGSDKMVGGVGDDTYYVDTAKTATTAGDKVVELDGQGFDTVRTSVSYALTAFVERLYLDEGALNGTGNDSDNTIYGNAADNVIDGRGGSDLMAGGAGNDTYHVDRAPDAGAGILGDRVAERSGEGIDTVRSTVSFTLSSNVETLVLTGAATIDGTGNGGDNMITGNGAGNVLTGLGGADTIDGGAGNDDIYGGAGKDMLKGSGGLDDFFFDTALSATSNVDKIASFVVADDTIMLSRSIFTALGPDTTLAASAFALGTAAGDADDRIIYDKTTGSIWYDADGNGNASAKILFAQVDPNTALTNLDFQAYTPPA
jgi:Ca2+-binding RTX toxin-like protein